MLNNEQKKNENSVEKTKNAKKKSETPKRGANDDFKRKYFEYYDDIKISDRQDW